MVQGKMSNILWLQLLKCEDCAAFLCHIWLLNLFGFCTVVSDYLKEFEVVATGSGEL